MVMGKVIHKNNDGRDDVVFYRLIEGIEAGIHCEGKPTVRVSFRSVVNDNSPWVLRVIGSPEDFAATYREAEIRHDFIQFSCPRGSDVAQVELTHS